MLALHLSIYATGLGALLLGAVAVLASDTRLYRPPIAAFFVVCILVLVFEWLMAAPEVPFKSLWLTLLMATSFLFAPCALALARATSGRKWAADSFEMGTVIAGWVLLIPLASSMHPYQGFENPHDPSSPSFSFFIHTTMLMAVAVFMVQSVRAIAACRRILRHRHRQNCALYASDRDSNIAVLRIILAAMVVYAVISSSRVLYCAALDDVPMVNLLIAVAQVFLALGISGAVVRQLVRSPDVDVSLRQALFDSRSGPQSSNSKYQNSPLSSERVREIRSAICHALDTRKMYLDPDMSLSTLSEFLGETPHTLSQVINRTDLTSFREMVTRRRIEFAQRAMTEYPKKGILDIAFESGFGSKSAFNSSFKRQTGLTPTQYRSTTPANGALIRS